MDQASWRQAARRRLQNLARELDNWAPGLLYGATSGLSLLPLVTAGADPASALAGIIGGIGGNLVAEQLSAWHKRTADPEDEAAQQALAKELTEAAKSNAHVRQTLDAVLHRLGALETVVQAVADDERSALVETLTKQLARVGSGLSLQVDGDLISTQIQQVAAHAVVAVGKGITQNVTQIAHQEIHNPPAPDPAARGLERYLRRLRQECHVLPLAALGGEEGASREVTLDQVYIELDTQTRLPLIAVEKAEWQKQPKNSSTRGAPEERILPVMEAARNTPRLVLLGNAGGGKSTFVRQLVAWLAGVRLRVVDPQPGWPSDLLPIFTILRDLAPPLAALPAAQLTSAKGQSALVEALRQRWQADLQRLAAADLSGVLEDALVEGRVLLVLDGLDEVPSALRTVVRQAVVALHKAYPNIARIVVTSRIRSYTGAALLPDFTAHTLADFDNKKIQSFVQAWYGAQQELGRLTADKAQDKIHDLQQAALAPDLRDLAANPMLLTTMAIIHQRETTLPKERARLYDLAVKVLLTRWQRHKEIEPSERLAALLTDDLKLRQLMEFLAYTVQRRNYQTRQANATAGADLPRTELLGLLESSTWLGDPGLAGEFLDYVDQRAGLLVGRGDDPAHGHPQSYAFPHRTFQEYLAGCYLITGRSSSINRTYWQHASEEEFWHLAAQLGAEQLLYNQARPELLLDLMYALCPSREPQSPTEWRALLWSGHMATLVERASILADQGQADNGPHYLARLIPRLIAVMRSSPLNAPERAEAGRTLATLGDPRFRADAWLLPDEALLGFVEIPAGEFIMGEDEETHQVTLPTYYIARYPVTVAQFRTFVEATDRAPTDPDSLRDPANHPVRYVTWHEALRYCRWLTEQLRQWPQTPEPLATLLRHRTRPWQVTLPSEAEWEKAARGASTGSATGRIYPWGDQPDPNRANYDKSGINSTSAVGCFPGGVSPYGVEDLSGNVWEWTRTLWGKDWQKPEFTYPYQPMDGREQLLDDNQILRVVRGGSFADYDRFVRCAVRCRYDPYYRGVSSGWRLVVSPFTPEL